MFRIKQFKTTGMALGAVVVTSLTASTVVSAETNPFQMQELTNGYLLAAVKEGKCGEGKCGEGKCGSAGTGSHAHTKGGDIQEGKCGEGKCGEGKCGGALIGEHRHDEKK